MIILFLLIVLFTLIPEAYAKNIQIGMASWYGPGFHGHRATDGSIFNQYKMTAAHKTLPLGTIVKVTNRKNRRFCTVKITDRGPYFKNRIIDVSEQAAKSLDMKHSGVAYVIVEVMK